MKSSKKSTKKSSGHGRHDRMSASGILGSLLGGGDGEEEGEELERWISEQPVKYSYGTLEVQSINSTVFLRHTGGTIYK
jgi:hypothetical protein